MNSVAMSNEGRAAKILDALQNDLKSLCMETKKRYPHIKDVSGRFFFVCNRRLGENISISLLLENHETLR